MADSFRDSRHSDCATCHRVGFEEPLAPDPYGYVAFPFQNFYSPCPWWVDCGSGGFIGGVAGGNGDDPAAAKRRISTERYLGIRGGTRPDPMPPTTPVGSPAGTSVGNDSPNQGSSSGNAEKPAGQQSGRTMKQDSKDSKDSKPDARDDRKHDPNRRKR